MTVAFPVTFAPEVVRVTRLDIHGAPTGEPLTIRLTQPKEHTTMTDENPSAQHPDLGELDDYEASMMATRPSKAMVAELLQVIRDERATVRRERAERTNLVSQRDDAVADRDRWRNAKASDPEAEALAGCVRAIEGLHEAQRLAAEARRNRIGSTYYGETATYRSEQPAALTMPEGRILLSLAARFGVPIEATPPIQRPAGEQVLVSVPAHVAEQLNTMPRAAFG